MFLEKYLYDRHHTTDKLINMCMCTDDYVALKRTRIISLVFECPSYLSIIELVEALLAICSCYIVVVWYCFAAIPSVLLYKNHRCYYVFIIKYGTLSGFLSMHLFRNPSPMQECDWVLLLSIEIRVVSTIDNYYYNKSYKTRTFIN